jgi:adenylate cyclase
MSFFSEFRRRNVPQVALAYLAGAWLLLQVMDTVFPLIGLGDDAGRVVLVLLAIGFFPALILAWVFEWTPQGIRRESDLPAAPRESSRRFERVIIVLLVLAVSYFLVDEFILERVPDEQSIVVLPFENLSSDPDQAFFADGLARELRTLLSGLEGLKVTPHTTSESFGPGVTIEELRDRLGATHVLEGSVQKAGNEVRIVAQLVDARTEKPMWSESFDGVLDDVFALQDRYVARVIGDLQLRLVGAAPTSQPIDPRAYELYLRAVDIWEEGGSAEVAIAALEEALSIEPDYVPAMGELAKFVQFRAGGPETEVRARVRALVGRMADIAPDSFHTNAWRGWIAWRWDNDPQQAATYFERAIADNPTGSMSMLRAVSGFYAQIGRGEEGYALARYALTRDPANERWINTLAWRARALDNPGKALEYLDEVAQWQPLSDETRWHLGVVSLVAGQPQKALDYFSGAKDQGLRYGRIFALYDLGRLNEFEAEFAALREERSESPESLARIYAWTGENEAALEHLEELVEQHGPGVAQVATTDLYSRLRTDPRYHEFLARHGWTEEDLSSVRFDPPFPPEMQAEIDEIVASLRD